ncbi:ABC transporter permease [Plantibacter sp. YIM 135347]|uniref:ABC transporter permease n=1 Tax=Plantibacter sp. YIM 135347 TaxID=3423919 RepID=UPI003D329C41
MNTEELTRRTSTARSSNRHRVSFIGAIRAELLKLATVRAVLVTLLATVPLGVFFAFIGKGNLEAGSDLAANAGSLAQIQGSFLLFASLIVSIASVLSIASEHSTGQIGSTLTILPRRGIVVAAKAIALGGVVWVLGFVTAMLSGLVLMGSAGPLPSNPFLLITASSIGAGFAWAAVAIIGLGIGGVLRSAAFGIASAFTLFFIAPLLLSTMGLQAVLPYLPNVAGVDVITSRMTDASLHGAAVLAVWVVVSLVGWGLLLRRRDV